MNFKENYTIIIKFTQNDNIAAGDEDLGWVDYFAAFLKTALNYRVNGEVSIQFKNETELISAQDFNNSDLIFYILSPAFIFSSNINQDAEELEAAFNFDIPLINTKLKKVFKAPVAIEELPLSISTPTYYRFFDYREVESEEYTTFEGWNTYQENVEFWKVFADVINDAFKLFSTDEKVKASKKIFISNESTNYFHNRNNIKRELNTFNISVFPDEDFSIEANYMEDPEIFFMKKCDISLHFPDEFIKLSTDERTKAFEKLPESNRFIWFDPQENLNPEKKAVYNELKIQLKPYKNIEAIETPIEELKEILKASIFKKSEISKNEKDNRQIIYLLSDSLIDESVRLDLDGDSSIQSNFNLKILSNVENVADYRLMHYDLLKKADIFLILHLNGNQEWVKTMVSEVKKAPGFDRLKPISKKIVCVSNEAQLENISVDDFEKKIINNISDITSIIHSFTIE